MSTLLRVFLTEGVEGRPYDVDPALCQVADVFAGAVWTAPDKYKRRMQNVAAACNMIRRLWSSY